MPVSIHALRVECDMPFGDALDLLIVSIHALRVECDIDRRAHVLVISGFNPRTPCGVRPDALPNLFEWDEFQSTHSVWSATGRFGQVLDLCPVSIHALRVECDQASPRSQKRPPFQSTHSVWSATEKDGGIAKDVQVSIHALRVECDVAEWVAGRLDLWFQSTHSVWSATINPWQGSSKLEFQSTHSVWSATSMC